MAARLLFFGRLRDIGGAPETAPPGIETLSDLRAWMADEAPELSAALAAAKARVAIDGEIAFDEAARIGDAREIAFLPPMSGG